SQRDGRTHSRRRAGSCRGIEGRRNGGRQWADQAERWKRRGDLAVIMKPSLPASPNSPDLKGVGIADLCIKRPVFALMMNLFLVVLGWFSFRDIGVDQFPNVELPIITVTTTLRGASPEEMETSVTKPLEEIINTIQGIDELSSITTEGVSQITITFLLDRSRDIAAQDVRDKVNTILARLP